MRTIKLLSENMTKNFPVFKYHYNPVKSSIFQRFKGVCSCCGNKTGWKYIGPFYCIDEIENLCPWCIKDGSAAEKFDLTYVDEHGPEKLEDSSKLLELTTKTPGYFSAHGDPWPAHCNDYCSLLGMTNWAELEPLLSELEIDIKISQEKNGLSYMELVSELNRKHSPLLAHLFKCNHCGKHRFTVDYE